MSFIISTQLKMIESTCLVQSFTHRHDNTKINNGCDNFKKKQDAINICLMRNNDVQKRQEEWIKNS